MTNTYFDFEDGNGPVPAHQHSNGGGWVADTAKVYETSYVGPDAQVYGDATVSGNARVSSNARVYDDAWVSSNARVSDDARVYGNATVSDDARVYGNAHVGGNEPSKEQPEKDRIFINGKWYVEEVEDDE